MATKELDIDPENWMSQLPEDMLDSPIAAIAVPGSHNSFTSSLDRTSEIGPDADEAVKVLGPLAKGAVYSWSVTQSLDLKSQLLHGIRYLDLRVTTKRGTTDIYFVHTLFGSKVADAMDKVLEFVNSHKKEIIILDFNHFYDMGEGHHRDFINMLLDRFSENLCIFVGVENLTLRMLWENGLQIVIIYHHEIASEFVQLWPGQSSIVAPYANTISVSGLLTFLDSTLTKSRHGRLHVTQGVLTQDTSFVLRHLNSSLLKECAEQVMPELSKWIQGKPRGIDGLNIVMADFIELNNFVKIVIALNFQ